MKAFRNLSLLCLLFLLTTIAMAQESKFHAIFLYKFIENISWPESKKALVIGFIGETEVKSELEKMLKARGNSTFTIRTISPIDADYCDVIFLTQSQSGAFSSLLEKTTGKSILIVTESSDLASKGAGISFLKDGNKLSFAINKSSLEARSLKVSFTLLTLGKAI
ncbi:MAG TPA: YfiR family protein [Chryseosolibacter sp.]|nr:YfiR family protein [Chryseosolibacter sp.]